MIQLEAFISVSPYNFYRFEENRLIWERSDFEPQYNLGVTLNTRYTDEFIKTLEHEMEYDKNNKDVFEKSIKEIEDKRDFFNISKETINENRETYYKEYRKLIYEKSMEALFLKSALGISDGIQSPKIEDCRVVEEDMNTWRINVCATDPDFDIVKCYTEITGIEKNDLYGIYIDELVRYNQDEHNFVKDIYICVEELKPFNVTFTMVDAAGNTNSNLFVLLLFLLLLSIAVIIIIKIKGKNTIE